jgi:hypothetical protein
LISIKSIFEKRIDDDIKDWCYNFSKNASDKEILEEVRRKAEVSRYNIKIYTKCQI